MTILPSSSIFGIIFFLLLTDVYSYNYTNDFKNKSYQNLQPVLFGENIVPEISHSELDKILASIPPEDYVVLFYLVLNESCRKFLPIFNHLYQDVISSGYKIRLVKFNCQGMDKRIEMCQYYNIKMVPTLAYISSYPVQRSNIPQKSYVRRIIRYFFCDKESDLNLENATRYKGDLFNYDEILDWVSLMYNISTINRTFGSKENFISFIKQLWNSFISLFK